MAQFVGLSVLATLREPPAKVRGLVTAVVEQKLTLDQVTWLSGASGPESLIVHGSNVLDVEIIESEPKETVQETEKKDDFVDPAIVSYGRPEGYLAPDAKVNGGFVATSQTAVIACAEPSLLAISPVSTEPATTGAREELQSLHPAVYPDTITPSATLTAPFNDLSLNGDTHEERLDPVDGKILRHQDTELLELKEVAQGRAPNSRKRTRRSGARGGSLPAQTQDLPDLEPHTTPVSTQKRRGRGKGWRQTPLLEEPTRENPSPRAGQRGQHPQKDALEPGTVRSTKQTPDHPKLRRRRYREEEDQNGWATGDATDIQDMGDFDFEENLSKFDKRKVFDQIRQEDTTADEARLVSFNRLPAARAGTAGGKNLHYTENVLDSPIRKVTTGGDVTNVDNSSTESELEVSEAKISSGRSSRKNVSRPSRAPSRKGSALTAGDHYGSGSTFVAEPVGRLSRQTTHDRIASPKIKTDSSTSRYRKSSGPPNTGKSSFRITSSNCHCPCVSPLQMLELEQLSTTELGLTEEMLTENAARCIAETAYGLTSSEDAEQPNHRPLIVILVGNTKTGSRAIAAGRHLRNHGVRVVLCILGLERECDLLESVQRQLTTFRSCGGQAIKQDGLMRTLRKLQAPTDLIVDALLGMHLSFDDLRTDDQAAYFQLVCWANGSDAGTFAVDLPSGIDPSSGIATTHDGSELVLNANFILSLGAPKTGLLVAMESLKTVANPSLFVADIGIASVAWKKFGMRRKGGVEFGGEWIAAVRWEQGAGA
ncbi:hypothetical protein HO173_003537 [Letharia columbiana]|uniref:Enhancer of mRNA-decapping protein 3 n=1 Tax=Letharia columbiana TaxID=112416 RepID=A0A8H6G0S4_9LECA|nr:uncharacterized protein HO173_003537 [Letharia columbiana]KAF6238257.1 hypothetical protein HO173_003537 [Letharia columbiana]